MSRIDNPKSNTPNYDTLTGEEKLAVEEAAWLRIQHADCVVTGGKLSPEAAQDAGRELAVEKEASAKTPQDVKDSVDMIDSYSQEIIDSLLIRHGFAPSHKADPVTACIKELNAHFPDGSLMTPPPSPAAATPDTDKNPTRSN